MSVSSARKSKFSSKASAPVVFVVDDDISVRESLELLIYNEGWCAETFESAQEFLCRPRVNVPSCLVLDVSLPGLNGLDLRWHVAVHRFVCQRLRLVDQRPAARLGPIAGLQ